jgi:hypothetical protein
VRAKNKNLFSTSIGSVVHDVSSLYRTINCDRWGINLDSNQYRQTNAAGGRPWDPNMLVLSQYCKMLTEFHITPLVDCLLVEKQTGGRRGAKERELTKARVFFLFGARTR